MIKGAWQSVLGFDGPHCPGGVSFGVFQLVDPEKQRFIYDLLERFAFLVGYLLEQGNSVVVKGQGCLHRDASIKLILMQE